MYNSDMVVWSWPKGVLDGSSILPTSTRSVFFEVLVVTSVAKTMTEYTSDGGD